MALLALGARNVRNIAHLEIEPSPTVNLFVGPNAAGKTSLLEAIHVLATGRSFRTSRLDELTRHGQPLLRVTGSVREDERHASVALGVERSQRQTSVRVGGRQAEGMAELARVLPVQALHPESHQLVAGGPRLRRAFLDWGAFYHHRGFQWAWQRYRRALQQRNRSLRLQGQAGPAQAWDQELSRAGEEIDAARRAYVSALRTVIPGLAAELLRTEGLELRYQRGWREEASLAEVLAEGLARDREQGYTAAGPHRADLRILLDGQPAAEVASRGQQKLAVTTLRLAQIALFRHDLGRQCAVLLDDLASELDRDNRGRVLEALRSEGMQLFITAIDREMVPIQGEGRVFHVERGVVEAML